MEPTQAPARLRSATSSRKAGAEDKLKIAVSSRSERSEYRGQCDEAPLGQTPPSSPVDMAQQLDGGDSVGHRLGMEVRTSQSWKGNGESLMANSAFEWPVSDFKENKLSISSILAGK